MQSAGDQFAQGVDEGTVGMRKLLQRGVMMTTRQLLKHDGQPVATPRIGIVLRLPSQLRQLVATNRDEQGSGALGKVVEGTVALRLSGIEAELLVEIVEANGLEVEDPADGKPAADRRLAHHHGGEMAARRPAGGEDAVRIAPPIRKIIMQPGGGGTGLDDDIIHT